MLAIGDQFNSVEELAEAFMPDVEPGKRAPKGRGRDAYLKAAKGLESAGHIRRRKGKARGFGKPGENVTEVSAIPFAAPQANVQVNSGTAMNGLRSDLHEYASGPEGTTAKAPVTCRNDEDPQANSGTAVSGVRDDVHEHDIPAGQFGNRYSRDAPLYTDVPPDPPTPADDLAEEAGREGTASPEHPANPLAALSEQANLILDALPRQRSTNSRDRDRLVPAIVDRLSLGWPSDVITEHLTAPLLPEVVKSMGGLMAGWLPPQRQFRPPSVEAPGARESPSLPPWCGSCGGDYGAIARNNPKYRTLDGEPDSPQCPDCHPNQNGTRP
jgi:hypothetical protein